MKPTTRSGRLIRAALCCALAVASAGIAYAADPTAVTCENGDAGNTADKAALIGMPVACRGDLTASDDSADWYAVSLVTGQHIRAQVSPDGTSLTTELWLLDPAGQDRTATCAENENIPTQNTTLPDNCSARADVGGTWRIGITRETGAGTYKLVISATDPQNDCGSGADAPQIEGQPAPPFAAAPLILMTNATVTDPTARTITCNGSFDADAIETSDLYSFAAPKGSQITPTVTATPSVIAGAPVITGPDGQAKTPVAGKVRADQSGTWYLTVPRGPAMTGSYAVDLQVTQDDCPTTTHTGDSTSASPGSIESSCTGQLDGVPNKAGDPQPDIEDVLTFPGETGTPLNVGVTAPPASCVDILAGAPNATPSARATACNGATGHVVDAGQTGTWKLILRLTSGPGGAYDISDDGIVALQADCAVDGDAGNTPATARPLTMAGAPPKAICPGTIRKGTDADFYSFTVPATGIADVTFATAADPALRACLFDAKDALAGECAAGTAGKATALSAGTWKVKIQTEGAVDDTVSYTFTLIVLVDNDCGPLLPTDTSPRRGDAGDTKEAARALTANPVVCASAPAPADAGTVFAGGALSHRLDPSDWYSIVLPTDVSALAVTLVPDNPTPTSLSDFDLCVTAPTGAEKCGEQGAGLPEVVLATPCDMPPQATLPFRPCRGRDAGGVWFIKISYNGGGFGAYKLVAGGKA